MSVVHWNPDSDKQKPWFVVLTDFPDITIPTNFRLWKGLTISWQNSWCFECCSCGPKQESSGTPLTWIQCQSDFSLLRFASFALPSFEPIDYALLFRIRMIVEPFIGCLWTWAVSGQRTLDILIYRVCTKLYYFRCYRCTGLQYTLRLHLT